MKKKVMEKVLIIAMFLFLVPSCYAQLELEETAKSIALSSSEQLFNKFERIAQFGELQLLALHSRKDIRKESVAQEIIDKADFSFMSTFKDAFILSDTEAKKILSGEYDKAGTDKDMMSYVIEYSQLSREWSEVPPLPATLAFYSLSYAMSPTFLSDLELEFATRGLKAFLKQIKKGNLGKR